jgi:hypothetical protein
MAEHPPNLLKKKQPCHVFLSWCRLKQNAMTARYKTPKTCVRPTPQIISKVSAGFTNSAEFATIHQYSTDLVVIDFPKVVTVHTKFSTDHTKVSNVHPKFDKKCHVQFISPQFFKH